MARGKWIWKITVATHHWLDSHQLPTKRQPVSRFDISIFILIIKFGEIQDNDYMVRLWGSTGKKFDIILSDFLSDWAPQ